MNDTCTKIKEYITGVFFPSLEDSQLYLQNCNSIRKANIWKWSISYLRFCFSSSVSPENIRTGCST